MITVASDIHLNINNRFEDFCNALNQVADIANGGDLLLLLGDTYHLRNPKSREMNAFRDFLNKVKVPVILLIGNHDEDGEHTSVDEFRKFEHKNITCVKPPYILDYCGVKMWLWHGIVEGAEVGPNDYRIGQSKRSMSIKQVKANNCDLYLVGDIHKGQCISGNIIYPGSIERVDFGERNESKCVVLIDEVTKQFQWQPLKTRPMIQKEFSISTLTEFPMCIEEMMGAIVKVILRGTKEQIQKFDDTELRKSLSKYAYSYKVTFEEEKVVKSKSESINESSSLTNCFLEYASLKKFDETTKQKGLHLLNES